MLINWRIELLAGLRARQIELAVTHFETRKVGSLLAYLAYYGDRAHSREVLAELLWPEEDLEATRDRFRQALSALRRVLEPPGTVSGSVLRADRSQVQLNAQAYTTDVADFEAMCQQAARAATIEEQVGLLRQAAQIYRGELLPGYYEGWIAPERERLAEMHGNALSQLASLLAQTAEYGEAIEYARRSLNGDPLREEAHANLMRLYAAAGRMGDVLRQYRELERVLRSELGAFPSPATRNLFEQLRASQNPSAGTVQPSPPAQQARTDLQVTLESEGGAVPLDSAFYIVRPTDVEFEEAMARHDSLVLVKGARQMGKTSLLARGLQQARRQGARVVLTDLQKFTATQMQSADALFLTLTDSIADQLGLDISLEKVWNKERGWNTNFERFLRREALGLEGAPVVWGLDELDRLFGYPYYNEVFGLFRSWHNERSLDPDGPWGRLTLAMAYATEAHLFITDLNQSPFNVGTRVTLSDFTPGEVAELNLRYGSPLRDEAEVARYFALVGGHPYLVRRGLHAMAHQGMDIAALEAQAGEEGIFSDHLHRLLEALRQDVPLCMAVRALLRGEALPTPEDFYRLRSAGIIEGKSMRDAKPRCRLYQRYLEQDL